MKSENIRLKNYEGTYYVVDEAYYKHGMAYLLESEQYGDAVPGVIINGNYQVLCDEIYNGFDDLYEEE